MAQFKRHFRYFGKLLLALLVTGTGSVQLAFSENLVLQGSTTFATGLVQPYGNAIESQTGLHLEVIPNKSNLGLIALFEGKADLAMISTTLEKEVEILRRSNLDLRFDRLRTFEIARTRAALVVHPSNPIRSVRLEDVRKILTGEITSWRQLGGPELTIRVVAVREGGGARLGRGKATGRRAHFGAGRDSRPSGHSNCKSGCAGAGSLWHYPTRNCKVECSRRAYNGQID